MEKLEATTLLKKFDELELHLHKLKLESNSLDEEASKLLQIMHNEINKKKVVLPFSYRDSATIVSIFRALYSD